MGSFLLEFTSKLTLFVVKFVVPEHLEIKNLPNYQHSRGLLAEKEGYKPPLINPEILGLFSHKLLRKTKTSRDILIFRRLFSLAEKERYKI
jgi:hypothetical protein